MSSQQHGRLYRAGSFLWHKIGIILGVTLIVLIVMYYRNIIGFGAWVNSNAGIVGTALTALGAMIVGNPLVKTYVMSWPWSFLLGLIVIGFPLGIAVHKYFIVGAARWGFNKTMQETGLRPTASPGLTNAPHSDPLPPPRPREPES
jgi:hypothetical protein